MSLANDKVTPLQFDTLHCVQIVELVLLFGYCMVVGVLCALEPERDELASCARWSTAEPHYFCRERGFSMHTTQIRRFGPECSFEHRVESFSSSFPFRF